MVCSVQTSSYCFGHLHSTLVGCAHLHYIVFLVVSLSYLSSHHVLSVGLTDFSYDFSYIMYVTLNLTDLTKNS